MSILRARFKHDVIAEFLLPRKPSNKVVILCDGMPTVPHKRRVLEFFSKKGFWVFHPRYRGTWESGGEFLADDPTRDILDVVDELQTGTIKSLWDSVEYTIQPEKFFVIGSSFGGAAAILSTLDPRVTKAVALSPVVDWVAEQQSPEEPMDKFGVMVQQAFGYGYRFTQKNWERLSRGELYNPAAHVSELDAKKFMIIHAADDTVVVTTSVVQFAHDAQCQFLQMKKGGHFGLATAMQRKFWRRIKKFLKE